LRSMQHFTYKYWSTTQTKGGEILKKRETKQTLNLNPSLPKAAAVPRGPWLLLSQNQRAKDPPPFEISPSPLDFFISSSPSRRSLPWKRKPHLHQIFSFFSRAKGLSSLSPNTAPSLASRLLPSPALTSPYLHRTASPLSQPLPLTLHHSRFLPLQQQPSNLPHGPRSVRRSFLPCSQHLPSSSGSLGRPPFFPLSADPAPAARPTNNSSEGRHQRRPPVSTTTAAAQRRPPANTNRDRPPFLSSPDSLHTVS